MHFLGKTHSICPKRVKTFHNFLGIELDGSPFKRVPHQTGKSYQPEKHTSFTAISLGLIWGASHKIYEGPDSPTQINHKFYLEYEAVWFVSQAFFGEFWAQEFVRIGHVPKLLLSNWKTLLRLVDFAWKKVRWKYFLWMLLRIVESVFLPSAISCDLTPMSSLCMQSSRRPKSPFPTSLVLNIIMS